MSAESLTILFVILIVIYLLSILITTLMDSQRSEGDRRGATKKPFFNGNRVYFTSDDIAYINNLGDLDRRCAIAGNRILNEISHTSIFDINFNYWTTEKIEVFIEDTVRESISKGLKIHYHLTRKYVMSVINQVRIEQI